MLEYLHLRNVGPAPEMVMEPARRLNLLTGDNGLGKSFLLDIAWWAMSGHWPAEVNPGLRSGHMARPAPELEGRIDHRIRDGGSGRSWAAQRWFDRGMQQWSGDAGLDERVALILYAQVDGSFAVWDSARNHWPHHRNPSADRPAAYVFTPNEVWDGLSWERVPVCNGLILDWAGWQKEHGANFERLTEVLHSLSPDPEERLSPGKLTRAGLHDSRDIPTIRTSYGLEVSILHASAGVRRVAALAYLLVWAWQEHVRASRLLGRAPTSQALFLVDEPEAHLHPRWQRTILRSLLTVMNSLTSDVSVQLLAATHSPLILASLEPVFSSEQDAWFDLDLVRQPGGTPAVQLQRREWERHGDASCWLLSEAFDLGDTGSPERELALKAASEALQDENMPAERARGIDERLRSVLGETDPYWVRWRYVAERRGWLQ